MIIAKRCAAKRSPVVILARSKNHAVVQEGDDAKGQFMGAQRLPFIQLTASTTTADAFRFE
jgi:hypothetical protein